MSIPVTGGAGFIGPRSLSDIAVRDEGKEVRPDVRPQARKNRRGIRWNTLRIFSGRERRRWSRIVRRSRTINVGQAPGFVLDWFRRQGETIINVDKLTHAVQPTPDGLAQAFSIGVVSQTGSVCVGPRRQYLLRPRLPSLVGARHAAERRGDRLRLSRARSGAVRSGGIRHTGEGRQSRRKPCRPSRAMPSPACISTIQTS